MRNKSLIKKSAQIFVAAAVLVLFSSCNRGYGCPTNFSIDLLDVLKATVFFLF